MLFVDIVFITANEAATICDNSIAELNAAIIFTQKDPTMKCDVLDAQTTYFECNKDREKMLTIISQSSLVPSPSKEGLVYTDCARAENTCA